MTELNDTIKTSDSTTLADSNVSTAFKLYGWEISKLPPKIIKQDNYPHSPTTPTEGAHGFTNLFTGVIKACVSSGTTDGDVTFIDTTGIVTKSKTPDKTPFWAFEANSTVSYNINTSVSENITLKLDVASQTLPKKPGTANSNFNLWINGKAFSQGTTPDNNPNWHTIEWPIDSGWLQAPPNHLKIEVLGTGIWMKSATFKSKDIPLSASYYWKAILRDEATQNKTPTYSIHIKSGVTSSQHKIDAFAIALGLNPGDNSLDSISTKLSTALTTHHSGVNTISLHKLTDKTTYTLKMKVTPEEKTLTFQVWQLHIIYECNGCTIEQAVPESDAQPYTRTFSTPLHPKKKS